jgi:anti-anti-sigma regulatory factor
MDPQFVADRNDFDTCASIGAQLEIWIHRHTSLVVIRLGGLLDCSTRLTLLSTFDELLGNGDRNFLIDAADVNIADAAGMGALVVCQRRAKEAGGAVLWNGIRLDANEGG